jgi:hypothetical protein
MATNQQNFRVRNGLTIDGATTGSSNFSNAATGADINYVLPTAQGAVSTALTNDGSGNLTWALPGGGGSTFGNITIAVVDDNTISTTSGNLTLDSTGGNIILNSNGTLGMTLAPIAGFNPNADFTGNIVKGVIRTGAGEATGDIWQAFGPTAQATGISIDNTDKPADRTNLVIRNYGASLSLGAPRLGVIGEAARGTAAAPLNLNSGNVLIDIFGNGYTNLGWATDLVATTPAIIRLTTTEAWTNGLNNTGTGLLVLTNPTATTLSAASLQSTILANPQIFNCRSDAYSWSNGKTGTTQRMSLDVSGNLTVSAGITSTTGNISTNAGGLNPTQAFNNNVLFNGNAVLLDSNTNAGGTLGITTKYKPSSGSATYTIPLANNRLGGYKINGDDSTAGTSGVLASQLSTKATENWATGTANGTAIELLANKKGVGWLTGHRVVASFSPDDSYVDATYININNPITSSTYNNASNLRFNAGDPAGATFNDRTSQLRVTTASTSSGDASTIVFNTGNYNTGTGNFSASVAADTLGEFFFGGNYGTGSNFTTLGPSVRFAAKAAETFTGTNSGGRFVVSIDKIGGNVQYDAITVDSANASIASDIITLESNTGTDYAVLNSTSATFAQPVGFPVKTAAQWNAITGAAGRQVSVSDSAGGSHPNGMMAFWDTTNARWSYIHDNSAV